jgi:hypothetical protein
MPTYVYEFTDGYRVGQTFEVTQKMSDPPLTRDPISHAPCRRVITAPIILGEHTDHAAKQLLNDNTRLTQAGMTKYQRTSDGTYVRTAGKQGPKEINPH